MRPADSLCCFTSDRGGEFAFRILNAEREKSPDTFCEIRGLEIHACTVPKSVSYVFDAVKIIHEFIFRAFLLFSIFYFKLFLTTLHEQQLSLQL